MCIQSECEQGLPTNEAIEVTNTITSIIRMIHKSGKPYSNWQKSTPFMASLNVIDDCNREALAIEVDTSLSSQRVIRTLERIIEEKGCPKNIRVDNGPEFIAEKLKQWCDDKDISLQYIEPGRPMQNGFIERVQWFLQKGGIECTSIL